MNLPTIMIGLVLLAVFVAIVAKGIQNRRRGKTGCSCGCESCSACSSCHAAKKG